MHELSEQYDAVLMIAYTRNISVSQAFRAYALEADLSDREAMELATAMLLEEAA